MKLTIVFIYNNSYINNYIKTYINIYINKLSTLANNSKILPSLSKFTGKNNRSSGYFFLQSNINIDTVAVYATDVNILTAYDVVSGRAMSFTTAAVVPTAVTAAAASNTSNVA